MIKRNWLLLGTMLVVATIALAAASGDRLKSPVMVGQGTAVTGSVTFDVGSGGSNPAMLGIPSGNTLELTGPVGIATTTPGATLGVQGPDSALSGSFETLRLRAAATNDVLSMGEDSTDRYSWIRSYRVGSTENNLLIQPAGGNVGIGTTAPVSTLNVHGPDSALSGSFETVRLNAAATNDVLSMGEDSTDRYAWIRSYRIGGSENNLLIQPSGGSVGVGTTAPLATLHVHGPDSAVSGSFETVRLGAAATSDVLSMGEDSTDRYAWIRSYRVGSTENNLLLQPAGGNVGVGTTTPSHSLEVKGATSGASPVARITDGTVNADTYIESARAQFGTSSNHPIDFIANGSSAITVLANGSVGINTQTPSFPLEVNGNVTADFTALAVRAGSASGITRLKFIPSVGTTATFQIVTDYSVTPNRLVLLSDAANAMYIRRDNGFVGILGVPTKELDVTGDMQASGSLTLNGTGGNTPHNCAIENNNASSVNTVTVTCSGSKKAISGGCAASGSQTLNTSQFDNVGTAWTCLYNSSATLVTAYAYCCSI